MGDIMIYIDFSDDKDKKKISTALEKLEINHNDIALASNASKNNIIISDNNIDKIKEYHKKYHNVIIFNKNKDALVDKVYYERGVYTYNVIDELNTILDVINGRNKNLDIAKKTVTASFALLILLAIIINTPNLLKAVDKNVSTSTTKTEVVTKKAEEEKEVTEEIDYKKENIVFYGDSITEMYVVEDYYGNLPVVNAGHSGYMTTRLLEEMDEKLLVYNPTKVFLLMGTNDLAYSDLNNDEIIDNITNIVKNLKKDRKNLKIYIESIYPVKETRDFDPGVWHVRENARIRELNEMLKTLCKNEKLTYIDVYNVLADEDGTIKEDYTIEGLHINKEGYKVITETLMPYVKEF